LNWHLHPHAKTRQIIDIEDEIFHAAIEQGVLVSRGSWFAAEKFNFVPKDLFFRATFAAASEEKMTEAIERYGVAVRASFGVQ
jgi:aromatic amino acid aminotransferase I